MNMRLLAVSDHPVARTIRKLRRSVMDFELPAPRLLIRPLLFCYLLVRSIYYFLIRVFVCEPLFKAYCTHVGRRVHTDVFVHFVQGKGELCVGDDVLVDGKCSFVFGARFSDRPTLRIGSHTHIGHNCLITVGKQVTIGCHCMISTDVIILDSSGHPVDPLMRLQGLPPTEESVREVTIGDNVWIGRRAMILPGVTIGEGSIVAAGSIVTRDVPPNTVVAGNPAVPKSTLQAAI